MLRSKNASRYLVISMGLLVAFVILAVLHVSYISTEAGMPFQQLFSDDPMVTLYFLLSMLHLFSFAQLFKVHKAGTETDCPPDRALLWVVLAGELLVLNVFVALGIFLFLRRQSKSAELVKRDRRMIILIASAYALFVAVAYILLWQIVMTG